MTGKTSKSYFERALGYAGRVISGDIIACQQVKNACRRQLNDLNRDNFDFTFDVKKAERICKFIENLPHTKGKWARQNELIKLDDWQIFNLTTIFGWVDRNGLRRFRTVYICVPRKNAKSTIAAGIALYCLSADGEAGAEVYSAATSREQAKIVWLTAKTMVDKSPGLRAKFRASTHAHVIKSGDGVFKSLSRDTGGNQDGLNVHCGVIDEYHAHKTSDIFDALENATGSREQPLLLVITTAGVNKAGPCFAYQSYVEDVISGKTDDNRTFGVIYTLDEGDDWTDPKNWQKANPGWGTSIDPEEVGAKAGKAISMASAQNIFKTKRLNIWVDAGVAWISSEAWRQAAIPDLNLNRIRGQSVWLAFDLSSKNDFTSLAAAFDYAGKTCFITWHFLPEATYKKPAENKPGAKQQHAQMQKWVREGRVIITPGGMVDYAAIEKKILEIHAVCKIVDVGYDQWQAHYLVSNLQAAGLRMTNTPMTVKGLSEPMKTLDAGLNCGKIGHDGNPILDWMISNVICHTDARDNVYPRKARPENKIDGAVAVIMALGRKDAPQEKPKLNEFSIAI